MAGKDRTPPHAVALIEALRRKPYAYGFYQTLRRLECANSGGSRIGETRRPSEEPVRLAQEPSLMFAPSTIASCSTGKKGVSRLAVYFLGLFGPNGPLPTHLTEYARDRQRNAGDHTFVRFVDIFHHRMLGLFYRAWANAEPTVNFDRPQSDRYSLYVGSLFGLGMPSLRDRDAMPDLAKLYYAGRFGLQTRNAEGLRAVLKDFFRLPVDIEEFVGYWMELPGNGRCRLGESPSSGMLGMNVVIGSHKWECHQKFRIVFGPLALSEYQRVLPGGETLARLVALVRNYVGDELTWDVNVILKKEEVPPLELGRMGQLGWTTWLTSEPVPEAASDLYLTPLEYTH